MSRFDQNLFDDPAIDNPFADPSVQQVTRNTANTQRGLDDYNPFDSQPAGQNAPSQQPTQPAIMQAVSPPLARGGAQPAPAQPPPNFTTADFQRRQEELERKAEELARREAELNAAGGATGRRNNWPPLPASCPLQPCFYQDINVDIPLEFQRVVRHLYYVWMFHALILALNIVGGMAIMIGGSSASTFGLSFVYFALLTPFSFMCWYRPIYKAFRDDSSLNFMAFFFIFIFQTVITTLQAAGIADTCGLITAIQQFKVNVAVGVFVFLISCGFIAAVVMDVLLLIKVHTIYRSSGLSMAKAQSEFTSDFLSNRHVQTAATNAAQAAAGAAVQNQFGNRY